VPAIAMRRCSRIVEIYSIECANRLFLAMRHKNPGACINESLFGQGLVAKGEEVLEFRSGQLGQPVLASADDRTGDLALGFDDLVELLLDRSDADKLVNLNVLFLPDSEGTFCCLVLDRGTSPPVEMEDMVGGRVVQPCPIGLERKDEETRLIAAARLKAIHHPVALGSRKLAVSP
jgi:hypothetical protein